MSLAEERRENSLHGFRLSDDDLSDLRADFRAAAGEHRKILFHVIRGVLRHTAQHDRLCRIGSLPLRRQLDDEFHHAELDHVAGDQRGGLDNLAVYHHADRAVQVLDERLSITDGELRMAAGEIGRALALNVAVLAAPDDITAVLQFQCGDQRPFLGIYFQKRHGGRFVFFIHRSVPPRGYDV